MEDEQTITRFMIMLGYAQLRNSSQQPALRCTRDNRSKLKKSLFKFRLLLYAVYMVEKNNKIKRGSFEFSLTHESRVII